MSPGPPGGGAGSTTSGLWLQPPSIAMAPSSPGPADQIRMIFGGGDNESPEEDYSSDNNSGVNKPMISNNAMSSSSPRSLVDGRR